MLFTSLEFILLLFPVALGTFLLARRSNSLRLMIGALVTASLAMYFYSEPTFVPIMLLSVVATFSVGEAIRRNPEGRIATALFALGIGLNLLPFLYFKYAVSLFTEPSSAVTAWAATTLPLGISFFTFQQIAYLLDVRRGTVPRVTFGKYLLFVLFFPHLIAGPIVRHNELIGQFDLKIFRQDMWANWAAALGLFGVALLKKAVVADHLADFVGPALAHVESGATPTLIEAWALMLSAAAQIYYDYSAYGDMALALALCFGLHLPISFYSPYQALSIADFWRRWNVTLMRFFRDHIYIPLGGNRHGRLRQILAMFATMVCCGIWHGAGGNFVAWGALVATLIGVELVVRNGADTAVAGMPRRIALRTIVLLAYVGPLAFFLFPDVSDALRTLAGLAGLNGTSTPIWLMQGPADVVSETPLMPGRLHAMLLAGAWAGIYLLPNTYQVFRHALSSSWTDGSVPVRDAAARLQWRADWRWALATSAGFVLAISALDDGAATAFYYFRF